MKFKNNDSFFTHKVLPILGLFMLLFFIFSTTVFATPINEHVVNNFPDRVITFAKNTEEYKTGNYDLVILESDYRRNIAIYLIPKRIKS